MLFHSNKFCFIPKHSDHKQAKLDHWKQLFFTSASFQALCCLTLGSRFSTASSSSWRMSSLLHTKTFWPQASKVGSSFNFISSSLLFDLGSRFSTASPSSLMTPGFWREDVILDDSRLFWAACFIQTNSVLYQNILTTNRQSWKQLFFTSFQALCCLTLGSRFSTASPSSWRMSSLMTPGLGEDGGIPKRALDGFVHGNPSYK